MENKVLKEVLISPKGFSASKCHVGNFWNRMNFFRNCLEIFWEVFGIFLEDLF